MNRELTYSLRSFVTIRIIKYVCVSQFQGFSEYFYRLSLIMLVLKVQLATKVLVKNVLTIFYKYRFLALSYKNANESTYVKNDARILNPIY